MYFPQLVNIYLVEINYSMRKNNYILSYFNIPFSKKMNWIILWRHKIVGNVFNSPYFSKTYLLQYRLFLEIEIVDLLIYMHVSLLHRNMWAWACCMGVLRGEFFRYCFRNLQVILIKGSKGIMVKNYLFVKPLFSITVLSMPINLNI